VLAVALPILIIESQPTPPTSPDPTLTVSRVIDGDTLVLTSCPYDSHPAGDSCVIRFIGVDTPELPSSPASIRHATTLRLRRPPLST
jgi:endonuclease YncB( thermonuclease family)